MRIHFAPIALLALGFVAFAAARSEAPDLEPQDSQNGTRGKPAHADGKQICILGAGTQDLGDGLSCESWVALSRELTDPKDGSSVRVLSYCLHFRHGLAVVSQTSGAVLVDVKQKRPTRFQVGGIDPSVADASLAGKVKPHDYDIAIGPGEGLTWGASNGRSDIAITLMRED